jgi:NAD(P)H dehydrogenase (quinone)
VAGRLARLGIAQRLIVEDSSQDPGLPDTDVRTVTGYDDAESLTAALADVETLFLIPVRERPDRVRQHESAVDAALAAGVNRIVDSSFLAAAPDAAFTLARDHYATEEYIRARGIPFTFVRGSAYLEVIHWLIGPEGVIRGPAEDGRLAPVARDDMADTAAAILTYPRRTTARPTTSPVPRLFPCVRWPRSSPVHPAGRSLTWRRPGAAAGLPADLRCPGMAGRGVGQHLPANRQRRAGRGQ